LIGRVLQGVGGVYRVYVDGAELECSLRGRIKQGEGSIAVGDRVEVDQQADGSCCIEAVLPRRGQLSRRSFAKRREQVLAANVDQLAAVVALTRPEPDLFLLDRLLAVAELNDLDAFIVVNKVDLEAEPESGAGTPPFHQLPESLSPYSQAGYQIIPTSVKSGTGIDSLRERLHGRITVFAGASGVGKSSLLNALLPGLELRVGTVGTRSGRGRHTTTAGQLIPLGDGSFLADTPGVQNFEPAALEPDELSAVFREFRPYLDRCRFADCRHRDEPGCAVREAVLEGRLSERRHESYLALLESAEKAARPWERQGP
jgi:ribosome biogenesis GTPase